jgi:hypothetical protein
LPTAGIAGDRYDLIRALKVLVNGLSEYHRHANMFIAIKSAD